ncbi:2'-5' RNA ligase family protein [Cyclobacterium jeungdonense]|uniref:2'-5' RNA ligase n=1 Tax=Cyclobacterium jeungdonense TaxID=708087 RepID=A0ABT8C894_9BACT|nr:hypothetical protein [Cyclobacterium jeungdonense]MDN3688751.1 hypothetical protein [Cyclobacterium jeungdonense]
MDIVRKEGFSFDPEILNPSDSRRGLTLLLRPGEELLAAFSDFIEAVYRVAPGQYYYPSSDIHVTLMPVISCYSGFRLQGLKLPSYLELIQQALQGIRPIPLRFAGVFASPSCLMIKGFPENGELEKCRNNLRASFAESTLEQSLDKRYRLISAHCTVIRFQKPVQQTEKVLDLLKKFQNRSFGAQRFDQVELVFNDWYQRRQMVQILGTFYLKGK